MDRSGWRRMRECIASHFVIYEGKDSISQWLDDGWTRKWDLMAVAEERGRGSLASEPCGQGMFTTMPRGCLKSRNSAPLGLRA